MKLTLLFLLSILFSQSVNSQNLKYIEIDSLTSIGQDDVALIKIEDFLQKKSTLSEREFAELLYHKSVVFFNQGDYSTSSKNAKESIDIIKQSESNFDLYYPVFHTYANASGVIGNNKVAIEECQEAISLLKKSNATKPGILARFHIKQAKLHSSNSEFDLSEAALAKGDSIINLLEDENTRLKISKEYLSVKAKLFAQTGKMKESIAITSKLANIATEEKDSTQISALNNTIALSYFRLGDYGKCKHHVEQSMAVNLKKYGEESPKMLRNYSNMGVVCMKLEDYDTAREYYEKTRTIIENTMGTENIEMSSLMFNLGVSHFQKQEYDKALPKFKESLRLRRKFLGDAHANVAHATQIIGATLIGQNKMSEAIPYLEKALDIRLKLGNPLDPELTRVYSNLAICHQYNENLDKAQEYVDAAYETVGYDHSTPFEFDKLVAPFMFSNPLELDISLATDRYKRSGTEQDYQSLERKGILADSIQNYLKFYLDDPGSRMVATAKNMLVYDELVNGYFERYTKTNSKEALQKAFTLFEKSKNTMMYEKLAEESSEYTIGMPNELIDQKFALEDSIAYYEELSGTLEGDELAQILKKVNEAKSAFYEHLAKIKKEYPTFYESVYDYPTISMDAYAQMLAPDEATISYFFGNGNTYGILIKEGTYSIYNCGESIAIDSLFELFSVTIAKRNDPEAYTPHAKHLYDQLIKPFDIEGISHLYILADNLLGLVPFEVLINSETNNFLLETHSISYHYSATLHAKKSNSSQRKGEILAMAPVFESLDQNTYYAGLLETDIFRDNLSALPNSENEINALASLFKSKKYDRNKATEAAFKKHASESHVIHLATHGFVDHNSPDNSRLYFYDDSSSTEDGKLHAFEIVNMKLNADLVTLSACNTGVGAIRKGEGVASLGRAFAYAGCPNQLISLWPANDQSTTTIMSNFYQNIDNGDTKAMALHNAKKQYLATSPGILQHPYYWSGFVYYGADSPLKISRNSGLLDSKLFYLLAFVLLGITLFYFSKK